MPLLFSYGTLQDPEVQQSIFGRTVTGFADTLLRYEKSLAVVRDPEFIRASGKARHAILKPSDSDTAFVHGVVLDVTDEELKLIDEYEPVGYARVVIRLASGRRAWVYIDAAFCREIDVEG